MGTFKSIHFPCSTADTSTTCPLRETMGTFKSIHFPCSNCRYIHNMSSQTDNGHIQIYSLPMFLLQIQLWHVLSDRQWAHSNLFTSHVLTADTSTTCPLRETMGTFKSIHFPCSSCRYIHNMSSQTDNGHIQIYSLPMFLLQIQLRHVLSDRQWAHSNLFTSHVLTADTSTTCPLRQTMGTFKSIHFPCSSCRYSYNMSPQTDNGHIQIYSLPLF